jgi:hypothetical protein
LKSVWTTTWLAIFSPLVNLDDLVKSLNTMAK